MIALDASAILAIISGEADAEIFAKMVAENDCIVGAPTRFEAAIVVRGRSHDAQLRQLHDMLASKNISTVAFGDEHVAMAEFAFERFGKGRKNPAQLNFGDCMAYAVASLASVPLLFKGGDFAETDIVSAIRP